MFTSPIPDLPTIKELLAENIMLREEIKVAREAASITAKLVVKQFEETEKMLRKFQSANAERQAVLDAATQLSIIATNLDGTITLFSPGATTLLGYSEEEMVKKCNIASLHLKREIKLHGERLLGSYNTSPNGYDTGLSSPYLESNFIDDSSLSYIDGAVSYTLRFDPIKVFDQYVKQKISQSSDWTYIKKDGSLLPINLSITPFHNAKGSLKGYLFTAMDISNHRLMENKLIEAMKNAESANASKGDFLARMSHEIRTPMNGVLGMAHLMKKTDLSPKQSNYLDKILSSANNLLNLINDILDFSKIDAGKLEIESISFNLEDVLSHLVNSIGLNAEEKGLEFVFRIGNDVPFNLVGDPLRLGQVLMNLASNAVKFTEHGEIIISVSLCGINSPDNISTQALYDNINTQALPDNISTQALLENEVILKFSVQDSGIGLYPEQIESLFDPFIQADDSITRKYGGTGLGLSICRQLTEMMGGKIWVKSSPGKGSEFIFTIRFKLSDEIMRRSISSQDSFKGLKALIVDDNEIARHVLKSMLESFKMRVDTAHDGKDAIESLDKAAKDGKPYDVVLLDWIMPGIDGIETARRIRANAEFAKIPAMLMVTANGREEARVEAEQAGLEGFLLKPVYASVMYNTLIDMLNIDCVPSWRKNNKEDDIKASFAMKGLKGKRVLLVEDNPINQEVATEFLKDAGIIVRIASNGFEALNIVDKEPFDLVLMDIQMPVMDGLEAARKIRKEKLMADIPIIAMTAHAMAGDREKSLNAGMNGHISKPVDPIELYNILSQFISDNQLDSNSLSLDKNDLSDNIFYTPSHDSVSNNHEPIYKQPKENLKQIAIFSDIKGIDYKTAIKRLNNKPAMLINILNDFKKNYSNEPERIRELFREGNCSELQIKAHTLKGIAGYMGADALFQSASKLEDFLKDSGTVLLAEAASFIEPLIQSIENIVGSLSKLNLNVNEEIDLAQKTTLSRVTESSKAEPTKIENSLQVEHLTEFMNLLNSGDANATDRLPQVQSILGESGYNGELIKIKELIDDIEYEAAGDIVKKIIAELYSKRA
ncbi:MAG: response regulator [Desulfamplus sp.]|nr:response regulator [Desulfamplus sp.]